VCVSHYLLPPPHPPSQVIVDEIYALSVYRPSPVPFTSVLSLLGVEGMGNDVHMIWALSKDFGGSGLRTGFCVTNNQELLKALGNVNCFSCVPHPLQVSHTHTQEAV